MRVIGLTGGIASGKTTATLCLEQLGARVIDADVISRTITERGRPVLAEIAREFGTDILRADGSLDRAALAREVFFDDARRKRLEGILHPAIGEGIRRAIQEAKSEGLPRAVLSVPLLFEAGLDILCDEIWTIDAPYETRLERIIARGLSRDEAKARIASQMPSQQRAARADVILDGGGAPEMLYAQVKSLWKKEMERSPE